MKDNDKQNNSIKVSVVVPIYNVDRYLEKCLESLHMQTLTDMEVICINDGSTDSCLKIIHSFLKKDSRFRVIDKPNTGYGHSMNVGIDSARGEYIGIVESDDYIAPEMFEKLYSCADMYNAEIVKSSLYYYRDDKNTTEDIYSNIFTDLPVHQSICPLNNAKLFIKLQCIWSAIYKRSFLEDNNIRFNETPGAAFQDVSFSFNVFERAKSVVLLPEAYYHYRISNQNSSVKKPNRIHDICGEVRRIEDIARKVFDKTDRTERLKQIISRLGFRVFLENYASLSDEYKYAMFMCMQAFLKKYSLMGALMGELWSDDDLQMANEIISKGDEYYYRTSRPIAEDNRVKEFSINSDIYTEAVLKYICDSESLIIYGAGKIGKMILNYVLNGNRKPKEICFAVSDKTGEVDEIEGYKVSRIESYLDKAKTSVVVVAVSGRYQFEIVNNLDRYGFKRVIVIDTEVKRVCERFIHKREDN